MLTLHGSVMTWRRDGTERPGFPGESQIREAWLIRGLLISWVLPRLSDTYMVLPAINQKFGVYTSRVDIREIAADNGC